METNTGNQEQELKDLSVERRTNLFNTYVLPHVNLVYKLCIRYSYSSADIEDNYNEVLINFYKYIESYDPARSIQTWLHIVTKRFIGDMNNKRSQYKTTDDVNVNQLAESLLDEDDISGNSMDITNYPQMYNDDILAALSKIKPIYREALLLQQAGYKLNEIMEISYRNGNLRTKNIETVKSRLFLAKQQMRKLITRDGDRREE
ncbi:RNA polymerase sigma factor [Bacteroides sp.]|uniref:RNA polymerase sigma factor n=1 Tax=Bacteroides sp. TaxID=29523 RepID=UPI0025BEC49F|nr:RNA polymerase sigma factor [Bacteroides sp.]